MVRSDCSLSWGKYHLDFKARPHIMGVLNITPDSFSDGGLFLSPQSAISQGIKMVQEGADIIDIGGESTRPFSDPVSVAEEIKRVVPVIKALASEVEVPISIDTTKASVAHAALEAGASVINDISALRADVELANVAAQGSVPVILMHMLGTPRTMQIEPTYENVVEDIRAFLCDAIDRAVQSGISRSHVIVDPGIGFGKSIAHNLALMRHLEAFTSLNVPLLVGTSRKTFIRNTLKNGRDADLSPDSSIVEIGTQATVAVAILNGAHIIRVHNVANTSATIKMIEAIQHG